MHHRLSSPSFISISLALGLGLLLTLGFLTRLALAQAPENTPQPIRPVDPVLKESLTFQAKAISGSQPWVWILCKFADDAAEPEPLSYFQNLYADTYPGLNHYLHEVSYNKADITGSQAAGWFMLPQPRSYYVYGMGGGSEEPDLDRLVNDCTQVAEPSVNFPNFYGINLMFNGSWPGFFGLTTGKNLILDGVNRTWPVVYMDNKGSYNAALTVHEMFHGFGLAHSSAYSPTTGHALGSSWDPVGVGACGFNSCTPNHIPAPQKDILGWITATHIYTATAISETVTLEALALPQTNNPLMVKIPVGQSSSHFYTVEARRQAGYDAKNPAAAILIHEVNPDFLAFGPFTHGPVRLVPKLPNVADQPWATGAIWNVGDSFVGPANSFTVSVVAATATGFVLNITQADSATPEIALLLDGLTNIPDNSGNISFGVTATGSPLTKTFIISNSGSDTLLLTEPITVPAGFTVVDSFGSLTVTAGLTTSFRVQLDATSAGVFSGALQFATNDPDEDPFNFIISGTVNALTPSYRVYLPAIMK